MRSGISSRTAENSGWVDRWAAGLRAAFELFSELAPLLAGLAGWRVSQRALTCDCFLLRGWVSWLALAGADFGL